MRGDGTRTRCDRRCERASHVRRGARRRLAPSRARPRSSSTGGRRPSRSGSRPASSEARWREAPRRATAGRGPGRRHGAGRGARTTLACRHCTPHRAVRRRSRLRARSPRGVLAGSSPRGRLPRAAAGAAPTRSCSRSPGRRRARSAESLRVPDGEAPSGTPRAGCRASPSLPPSGGRGRSPRRSS